MKKSLSVLFAALLPALALTTTLTSTNAMAHDDAQEHCYPLAHGEEGLGSRKTYHIPYLYANNSQWNSLINIKNTSHKNINVKITFRKFDGSVFVPHRVDNYGEFASGNSPINLEHGGAILKPLESGLVTIRYSGFTQDFTAEISWQADSCIPHAISGSLRNRYISGDRFDQSLVLLNGGKPF